jgi:hypothetical protein
MLGRKASYSAASIKDVRLDIALAFQLNELGSYLIQVSLIVAGASRQAQLRGAAWRASLQSAAGT